MFYLRIIIVDCIQCIIQIYVHIWTVGHKYGWYIEWCVVCYINMYDMYLHIICSLYMYIIKCLVYSFIIVFYPMERTSNLWHMKHLILLITPYRIPNKTYMSCVWFTAICNHYLTIWTQIGHIRTYPRMDVHVTNQFVVLDEWTVVYI